MASLLSSCEGVWTPKIGGMNTLAPTPIVQRSAQRAGVQQVPAAVLAVVRALGGFYRVDDAAGMNLHADAYRVRQYLGTYLPRTVQEVGTVVSELLALPVAAAGLPKGRALRVLDLGAGTGGAWMGLVYALATRMGVKEVEVHAVDGNPIALAQQSAFVQPVQEDTGVQVQLHPHEKCFVMDALGYQAQLKAFLAGLGGAFDFVLVSKHWNEFYRHDAAAAQGVMAVGVQALSAHLSPQGYLLVLEPTDRVGSAYLPNVLGHELAVYAQQFPGGLKAVVPVPCALFANGHCSASSGNCFTQRKFDVHLPGGVVVSNATYRVLTHAQHAALVRTGYPANQAYRVSTTAKGEGACQQGRRFYKGGAQDGFAPLVFYPRAA